ncbi:MAG: metallophosphoesterase [Candidatus Nanohaloarchaeota archaeon QJJ-5]|nr:metallophosphoesterase [Candidatus Nanohaloarchaeota archaeon QJJ-5]
MELPRDCAIIDTAPALYQPDLDAIIVADLHIGIESVQARQGMLMPKVQTQEIGEELLDLKDAVGASRLIVAGDVKHSFGAKGTKQREELRVFFDGISPAFETIDLVRGNHDSGLETLAEDYTNINVIDSVQENEIAVVHGHKRFEMTDCEMVIFGHEHPAIELKDDAGVTEKISCFLHGGFSMDVIVLPAFSPLASGTAINGMPRSELLSPILRNRFDPSEMYVTGIDREAGMFEFPELSKIQNAQ